MSFFHQTIHIWDAFALSSRTYITKLENTSLSNEAAKSPNDELMMSKRIYTLHIQEKNARYPKDELMIQNGPKNNGESMALKFWLGAANSDKSEKLIQYVLAEAKANPSRQYLVVVPEQICLSTQQEYVAKSENHGILNIDILPFTRLAHRITDEVGDARANVTTLDDMGKNLLLEHIANLHKDELPTLGENIGKLGYIEKVKSVISEFMQYGISVEKAYELATKSGESGRGLLNAKLKDVAFLYEQFMLMIKDKYTTVEETLDRTADIVHNSDTIKNSVIVFDGFTGFTPVQNNLIGKLMEYALDIHVALVLEEAENSGENVKEHELFYLSKQTVNQLEKMADERRIVRQEPYISKVFDSSRKKSLQEIEKTIFAGQNPEEEIGRVCGCIRRLVREEGFRYKDIAIITGDIETYRTTFERVLSNHKIQFFIDKSEPVLMNPFTEYIRSLISIYVDKFSHDSVFRFLKSGIPDIDFAKICFLENYCLATGIKGSKKWHNRFLDTTRTFDEDDVFEADQLRQKVVEKIDRFSEYLEGGRRVRDYAKALYLFIDNDNIESRLKESAVQFEEAGNLEKKEEYSQIYQRFMVILDSLCELIPDEEVSIKEFGELIDAALTEVRIGILPGRIDYVQVGDLTRSRLRQTKALFIVGANEGIIPAVSDKSGIINDLDKEFLLGLDSNLVMSPTVREDAYSQRLYLYMMMNAPTDNLYLSYSKVDYGGNSKSPSYIIRQIRQQYPNVKIEKTAQTEDYRDAYLEIISNLRSVVCGEANKNEADKVINLLRVMLGNDYEGYTNERKRLLDVVKYALLSPSDIQKGDSIGKALAQAIYGKKIVGSVTRLETYADCAYQYFLKYGLKLSEREEFAFEASDLGTIFHASLSEYTKLMDEEGIIWKDISDEDEKRLIEQAVETSVAKEHMAKMYTTARTAYMVTRIKRIMGRTVEVLKKQLQHGEFTPKYFEVDFDTLGDLNSLNIRLSDEEVMRLKGRIDRVDTAEFDDGIYVKIMDYKSSNKSMNLLAVYEGRQLQLLTYLNAVLESESANATSAGQKVIPAGVLYYHIDDPVVKDKDVKDGDVKSAIMKKLRLKGLVNSDGQIPEMIDRDLDKGSEVLMVLRKKDGEFKASGQLVTGSEFDLLSRYVNHKIKEIGLEILSGNIAVPKPDGKKRRTKPECKYCDYVSVCCNKTGVVRVTYEQENVDEEENLEEAGEKNISNAGILEIMQEEIG